MAVGFLCTTIEGGAVAVRTTPFGGIVLVQRFLREPRYGWEVLRLKTVVSGFSVDKMIA